MTEGGTYANRSECHLTETNPSSNPNLLQNLTSVTISQPPHRSLWNCERKSFLQRAGYKWKPIKKYLYIIISYILEMGRPRSPPEELLRIFSIFPFRKAGTFNTNPQTSCETFTPLEWTERFETKFHSLKMCHMETWSNAVGCTV